jgi:hypothetical protein
MALQANGVDVGAIQQAGIRSTVREMTSGATFGLYNVVLIRKWTGCFGVALRADGIHLRGRPEIFGVERAVRIMAVGALHQAFFHLVMEWHIELRFRLGVATEAEFWLRGFEELILVVRVVNAVAADTAHVVLTVGSAFEVGVLSLVATQAACIDLLGRGLGRIEDLCGVAATVYMRFTRAVAAFASHTGFAVHLGKLCVRI